MTLLQESLLPVSPEVVWRVLSYIESWPTWVPTITSAKALDTPRILIGNRFVLSQPLQPATVWRVTRVEANRSFQWQTERHGGFEAGHTVIPIPGGAIVQTWLRPQGRMQVIWPILRPILRRAISAEMRGLAERCRVMS